MKKEINNNNKKSFKMKITKKINYITFNSQNALVIIKKLYKIYIYMRNKI